MLCQVFTTARYRNMCKKIEKTEKIFLAKNVSPLPTTLTQKIDNKCHCGTKPKDDRVVNGESATKSEFPWLVALVEAKTRQPFCGGSVINDRFILTAGHCFKRKFLNVNNIEVIVNGHLFDATPNLVQFK